MKITFLYIGSKIELWGKSRKGGLSLYNSFVGLKKSHFKIVSV